MRLAPLYFACVGVLSVEVYFSLMTTKEPQVPNTITMIPVVESNTSIESRRIGLAQRTSSIIKNNASNNLNLNVDERDRDRDGKGCTDDNEDIECQKKLLSTTERTQRRSAKSILEEKHTDSTERPHASTNWSKGITGMGSSLNLQQAPQKLSAKPRSILSVFSSIAEWIGKTPFRSWMTLSLSICIEIVATVLLKTASDISGSGKTSTLTIISLMLDLLSILGLGAALKQLEVGIAYAVWSAVGTAAVSVIGIFCWSESYHPIKLASLSLIVMGVVGLNVFDDS